jgi:hypothetical protein
MTTADGHDVFLWISCTNLAAVLEFRRETPEPQGRELVAQVHVQRTIAAPPQQVFDWLLEPANLTVSPVFRKAGWAKDSSGPGVGAVREVIGIGYWGARTDHGLRRTPELLLYRRPLFPALATQWRHAHMHSVGRRHACRLGKRLHASGSLGRQGDRGSHLAADPLAYVPRDPRWLRQGVGELVGAARQRTL